jgi:tetratricopeptide (TPR) repeat protein
VLARVGAVAVGLLLAALALGGVELLLRLLGVAEGVPRHDPFAGFGSSVPMFERAMSGQTPVYRISRARLREDAPEPAPEDGREFRVEREARSFRAFVIGGSSAAGAPYPSRYAFPAWLERKLRGALPGLHIEVVNAALSGYATRRLLPIVRELAEYQPDLLIVYAGHNEWAERRYYAHLIDMDPRLFRLWEWSVGTRLYRVLSPLLRSGFRPFRDPEVVELGAVENSIEMFAVLEDRAAGGAHPSERELAYRDLLYEFNLGAMAEVMQAAGARTLFLTLSQNFSGWAPGASGHRDGLEPAELGRWEALYARGQREARRGDCRAAVGSYAEALAIDAQYAELHFRMARCRHELGELEEARRHYRLASDLDRVPHGAPTHFNDILRRVARAHGAPVVDIDAALARDSGDALVGDDLFLDWLHPNLRAHQLVAAAVAEAMRREGIPVGAGRWSSAAPSEPDPDALYAADPQLRLRESELRMFACLLALRDACARAEARALLQRQPDHALARQALARLETR